MKYQMYRACRAKYLLSLATLLSFAVIAQSPDVTDDETAVIPPDNWYQAEVILFTQQGNLRNEAPPKDYILEFPENWVQLTDPEDLISANELSADALVGELLSEQNELAIQAYPVSSENTDIIGETRTQIPEASIPYLGDSQDELTSLVDGETENKQEGISEVYVPEYEQPFLQLDKPSRDLNESASALDRRGYNVLFHKAWRFQITASDTAPWIIIKAGATDTNRFQLEGSVRFYQSRFLHFETNLWRLKFSDSLFQPLLLPDFPIDETSILPNKAPSNDFTELNLSYLSALPNDPTVDGNDQFAPEMELSESPLSPLITGTNGEPTLSDTLSLPETEAEAESETESQDITGIPEYPIEAVWVMKKSQRLQEEEVYYLDHPEMGILVTIKSYEPEPLNPPMDPELADETLDELIGEPSSL